MLKARLKKLLLRIRYQLPSKLPTGSEAFEEFSNSILETYNFPKEDSYKHSIAVMIQHLPATTVFRSKAWFASTLYNAQAREVAFYKIQEIQKKSKEKEIKPVELTQATDSK